jgi:hypothetical protein
VAVSSSHVYWANPGADTIVAANLNGTQIRTIATGQSRPYGVAVSNSHLYWANSAGTIVEANLNGAGAKAIAEHQTPRGWRSDPSGSPANVALETSSIRRR